MRKQLPSIAGLAIFLSLAVWGCNSQGGGGGTGPGTPRPFKLHGIFVRDANLTGTKDKADFQLTRNDTIFKLAALTIDTFKIDTTASTNYFRQSPPNFLRPGQSHSIGLVYAPSTLNFTTSLLMPDTFSIMINSPATHIYRSSTDFVQISWTGSANANGYLVACVNDSVGKDTSFFTGTLTTNASIPRQAFRNSSDAVVIGLYKIYVVALRDALFAYTGMPFPMPVNYTPVDTTYSLSVSGRIAAGFVAKYDTIRATTAP